MGVEALVPLVVPFLVGLLVGTLIRRAVGVIVIGAALVVVLVATGALTLTWGEVWNEALEVLPRLWSGARGLGGVLPYLSLAFLVGLALGLWEG